MRISRLIALCFFWIAAAHAQSSKTSILTEIGSCFPTQTTGQISPQVTVQCLNAIVASYQQYAGVNAQTTTSYTVQPQDYGQLLTFSASTATSVTIPQAVSPSYYPFNTYVQNKSTANVTIIPVVSTIQTSTTLVLIPGKTAWLVSDGTNYQVVQY